MARSDQHELASDSLVREVTRQLAGAAPPAPSWAELQRKRNRVPATGRPPTWPRLALVAASSAMVVSGLWWLVGQRPEPPAPVDRSDPVPTTVAAPQVQDPATAWREWVAASDPIAVQLCLVRTSSNLTASSDLPSPNARSGLEGDTSAVREMTWHLPSQTMLAAVVDHSDVDAVVASRAASVVEAYAAADEAQYGQQGEPSEEFAATVDAFLAERGSNQALRNEPNTCWLDTTAGLDLLVPSTTGLDATETLVCLAAAQLDHAAFVEANESGGGFDAIADAAGLALLLSWPQSPPAAVIDVVGEIQDAVLASANGNGARLDRARLTLADLDVPEMGDECPLTPVVASSRLSPTDSQPPSEE